MSSIDQRVLQMEFDNSRFERNASQSMKTLEGLKKSLDFDGATKSLEGLDKAGRSFSMDGMASAVENISSKFNAMGVIAFTVLQNITNAAVNAGRRMINAFAIKPVTDGFNEYELKMGSIQTIMASTGESLESVNGYLEELNKYADRTIYSFKDMTMNIGKFTNAGVSLKDSVAAIQGVSNVAAVSGANANEASRAMYNFAQALSAGYVKLIDWKSIENANMATVEFKNQLIASAVAAGTLTKQTDGMYKTLKGTVISATHNFNDSLQEQWMTTEVLVETLGKYADETTEIGKKAFAAAQDVKTFSQLFDTVGEAIGSGWAKTFELIIGDFEEAKQLLTGINNVVSGFVDRVSDSRNELLQVWRDFDGRSTLISALSMAFQKLGDVVAPIGKAFREIFPKLEGGQLAGMTRNLWSFINSIKIGDETLKNIQRTAKGFFAALDIGRMALSALGKGVMTIVRAILPFGDSILNVTGSLGDFIVSIRDAIKSSDAFGKVISTITGVLKPAIDILNGFVKAVVDVIKSFGNIDLSGLDSFGERVKERFKPFTQLGETVQNVLQSIGNAVKKHLPFIYKLGEVLGNVFKILSEKVTKALDGLDYDKLLDIFNSGVFATIGASIAYIARAFGELSELGGIKGFLEDIRSTLEAYQNSLKANTIKTIAVAIGILAAALLVLALIPSDKLAGALSAISLLMTELFGSMVIFEKLMAGGIFKSIIKVTAAMIPLALSLLVLAGAVSILAKLDWGQVARGTIALGVLMGLLTAVAHSLSGIEGRIVKGATGLILFAAAITILAKATSTLATLNWAELAKGLLGVGVLIAALSVFLNNTDFKGFGAGKALGIIGLATAIVILSKAVSVFGELDLGSLLKGLGAVGIVLAELARFLAVTKNSKGVISTAIGLTILGASMLIFGKAIGDMGAMPIDQIGRGLLAMAGALGAITLAMNFMPPNMLLTSVGLVAVSAAIVILSGALEKMGKMSMGEIGRALLVLGGALVELTIAMIYMSSGIAGAAAMLVMAAALAIFVPQLKALGSMSWGEIGRGLIALAGAFAVVGVAGLLLAPLTPALLALSGAVALLGIGVLAVGGGLLAFSAGLAALAVSGTAGAAALVAIVTAVVGLIPMVLEQFGRGIIALAKVISEGGPAILDAIKTIIVSFVGAVTEATPQITEMFAAMLLAILQTISTYTPQIVGVLINLLVSLLYTLAEALPTLVDAGIKLMVGFINGMADGIRDNTDVILAAMRNLISSIIEFSIAALADVLGLIPGIGDKMKEGLLGVRDKVKEVLAPEAGAEIGSGFAQGTADGLTSKTEAIKTAGEEASASGLEGLKNNLTDSLNVGQNAGDMFAQGISNSSTDASGAGEGLSGSVMSGLMKTTDGMGNTGMNLGESFTKGYSSKEGAAEEAGQTVATAGAEGAASKQKEYVKVGENAGDGIIEGLVSKEAAAQGAGIRISESILTAIKDRLVIQSPSKVMKNEVGVYIVEGIAEGIKANMSAEEQATKKAENIVKAFKDALDKVDLRKSTANLEFQLWDELNKSAGAGVRGQQQLNNLMQQLGFQQDKVELATAEYNETLKNFGSESEKTRAAYNKLLQEQIDLAKLSNEINEAQSAYRDSTRESYLAYVKFMTEYSEMLEKQGFTMDQIEAAARKQTGYNPDQTMLPKMEADVSGVVTSAMGTVETVYQQQSVKTFGALVGNFGDWGAKYAETLGDSFVTGLQGVMQKISKALDDMMLEIERKVNEFVLRMETLLGGLGVSDPKLTITPVIDTSELDEAISSVKAPLSATIKLDTSKVSAIASAQEKKHGSITHDNQSQSSSVQYIQNNYSPKPLSRLDIYRQTKNQLSVLKG